MDALELLTNDHMQVRQLFREFQESQRAGDLALTSEVRDSICQELEVHTKIEEEIFYPAVRERGGECAQLVEEGIQEHNQADELVRQVAGIDPTDGAFADTMRELIEAVEHHATEEENEMFPRVRESFDDGKLQDIGQRLQARKQQLLEGATATVDLTKDELYEKAKELDIDGRSKMNKDELAEAVRRES